MLTIKPELSKNYSPISLTTTLTNGSGGATTEFDNQKSITARLLYDDTFLKGKFRLLLGGATYQGGTYQATQFVH